MAIQVVGMFCEDIREEKSGQLSLIGLLPDNISVPPPPPTPTVEGKQIRAFIPKLCLYVRMFFDPAEEPEPLAIKLTFPGSDQNDIDIGGVSAEIIANSKSQAIANNLPIAGILHHAVLQGFAVPGSGKIVAVYEIGGTRQSCAVLNFKD